MALCCLWVAGHPQVAAVSRAGDERRLDLQTDARRQQGARAHKSSTMRRLPVVMLCALVSPAVAGLDQTISDLAAIAKYDAREAVRLQILSNSTGGARLVKQVALNPVSYTHLTLPTILLV